MEKPSKPERPWNAFIELTREKPPHASLLEALPLVTGRKAAIDIGAGALRDTKFLLKEGFDKVVAIDNATSFKNVAREIHDDRFQAVEDSFEAFDFPTAAYDIVNAQYSLPFAKPETFAALFQRIKESVAADGVFVGQLLGPNDGWKNDPGMNFHTRADVEGLLADMNIIKLDEKDVDGEMVTGQKKHWHRFDIIARK